MNFRKALVVVGLFTMMFGAYAFAQEGGAEGGAFTAYARLAAFFGLGIAAFGGALAQGLTAAAALEGIARNPAARGAIFVPMIIGLALIESLVLYAFVIAFVKIKI